MSERSEVGTRLGRYRLHRKLGEGGMGVVYAASDERLGRSVALKLMRTPPTGEALERFWREARAAARVSHPHICQLHEVGEDEGTPFIVMELLEGEPLAARIARGPLAPREAISTTREVLAALEALHDAALVHRDLKPSNVFLTPHGVKLLDFGLARAAPATDIESVSTRTRMTRAGMLVGTLHYMSPEQLEGRSVDARTDIFATGALLFEQLTGRRAFEGRTVAEVFHATVLGQTPAVGGAPEVGALDAVIRCSLAKRPEDRYSSAREMADALGRALLDDVTGEPVRVVPMTRLIVLPFRILRADSEVDFLCFSLPDAITSSLSDLSSLVVRSSVVAGRFGSEAPDLQRVAAEANVDVVLCGTILRDGNRLRVSTQLMEAPEGNLVWSKTAQVTVSDVFQVQDDLVRRIIESLALPLSAREERLLRHDIPESAAAYECYLRANHILELAGLGAGDQLKVARDLYQRCLEEDPGYAPAWARLGRCHRVLSKRGEGPEDASQAERCLARALELNPDLALGHKLVAQLEADDGEAQNAMTRLLRLASSGGNDPEVFAGLVHACRYCGLLESSIAAHQRARRLDPEIQTGVRHTYWLAGDYEAALRETQVGAIYIDALVLSSMGRRSEAVERLRQREQTQSSAVMRTFAASLRATLEDRREEGLEATERCFSHFGDPEARYYLVRQLAHLGALDRAERELDRVINDGFVCYPHMVDDPWLRPLGSHPVFGALVERARERQRAAAAALTDAAGERVL
jgi:non-specific serine/threonine protein kinase